MQNSMDDKKKYTKIFYKKINSAAFSLIELLIVISIISILSTIAIPSYNDYLTRAKVIKALSVLNGYKLSIIDYFISTNKLPNKSEEIFDGKTNIDLSKISADIFSIKYEFKNSNALISAQLKNPPKEGKDHIYLIGHLENDLIEWHCNDAQKTDSIPNKFYPKSCKN